jgi:predicted Zn finger-like uncharacterized protein
MIPVKCPHCSIGLKVDESKLPPGIESFKCPRCKNQIPISVLSNKGGDGFFHEDTQAIHHSKTQKRGTITTVPDGNTPKQSFILPEGISIIGRKTSKPSNATIQIETTDRTMSREHIRIEVKKDRSGSYRHCLADNNSTNHTLYNSIYLENGEIVILNNNDEIVIGHTTLRFNE